MSHSPSRAQSPFIYLVKVKSGLCYFGCSERCSAGHPTVNKKLHVPTQTVIYGFESLKFIYTHRDLFIKRVLSRIGHPLLQNISFNPQISSETHLSHYKQNIYSIRPLLLVPFEKITHFKKMLVGYLVFIHIPNKCNKLDRVVYILYASQILEVVTF